MKSSQIISTYSKTLPKALTAQVIFGLLISSLPNLISAQETVSFPSRASDLAPGLYWTVSEFSEGCCVIDLNIKKYIDGRWAGGRGSSNESNFDYGTPLYAPVNGEICSCWRNFPDENSNQIFTGGNHVVIKTDDNKIISLNHFKPGSIPPELCPNNSNNVIYPSTMQKEGNWRVAAYIPPGNRPKIREGQFIGQVGTSGNSGGPHLHIAIAPVTGTDPQGREEVGDAIPFRFRQVWGHNYDLHDNVTQEGWYRRRGEPFSGNPDCRSYRDNAPECGFKIVQPSPYLRRAEATAGNIRKADVAFTSDNRAVTAVIDSDNNLKLISWDLIGLNQIVRRHDINAGSTQDVQIISIRSEGVLVAVKGQNDELKLIYYVITPSGELLRRAEDTAGRVKEFEIVRMNNLPADGFAAMVAVRDPNNELKLIAWDVVHQSNGDIAIVRKGSATAGIVTSLAICKANNFRGVYTAVKDANNNLKIIPWSISQNGMNITRGRDIGAGTINRKVSIESIGGGVCVAVGDSDNNTRVITFQSSSAGDMLERKSTLILNEVLEVNLLSTPHAESNITAVVKGTNEQLILIGLLMNSNGTDLRRVGSSSAGQATNISADGMSRSYPGNSPRDLIITAFCAKDENLKLITWDTNLNNPE